MTRWRAAGIHLLASVVVLAGATGLAILLWYPPSLFDVAGADRLLVILAAIDVTVGPLLTLLVYRHGKRGMKFDLAVIALLQFAFFAYGANTFWVSRPVFIVAAVDRFELVFANEIEPADLVAARPPYDRLGAGRPRLVGLQLPPEGSVRNALLLQEIAGRRAIHQPRLYREYTQVAAQLLSRSRPVAQVAAVSPEARARLQDALRKLGRDPGTVRWLPLDSSRGGVVQLIDARAGVPLTTVRVDPWTVPD